MRYMYLDHEEKILKYKGGLFKKEILNRIDSEWKTWCVKGQDYVKSIDINDEGGVCIVRKRPTNFKDGSSHICDIDFMLDFKFKKRNVKLSCSNGYSETQKWSCYIIK